MVDGLLTILGSNAVLIVLSKHKLDEMLSGPGIKSSELLATIEFVDKDIAQTDDDVKQRDDGKHESLALSSLG